LVEQGIENPCVAGSIPAPGTTAISSNIPKNQIRDIHLFQSVNSLLALTPV
jgi:hypothetical protein